MPLNIGLQRAGNELPATLVAILIAGAVIGVGWVLWTLAVYLIDRARRYKVSFFGLHTWLALAAVAIFTVGITTADQDPANPIIGGSTSLALMILASYRVYSKSSDPIFAIMLPLAMALAILIVLFILGSGKKGTPQRVGGRRESSLGRDARRQVRFARDFHRGRL